MHLSLGARGLAGARREAAARGLRAEAGGRHALLDGRGRGPDRARLRRARARPLRAAARGRARAAAPVLGRTDARRRRSAGPSCACTRPTSARGRGRRPCARSPSPQARRAEAEAGVPRARAAQLPARRRRCPARPWWLLPGRRRRGWSTSRGASGACSPTRCRAARPRTSTCSTATAGCRSACTPPPAGRSTTTTTSGVRSTCWTRSSRCASSPSGCELVGRALDARAPARRWAARCDCGSTTTSACLVDRRPPTARACSSSACATRTALVVSLGSLADRGQPFTLVTRYAGRHDPRAGRRRSWCRSAATREVSEDSFYSTGRRLVYSNRTSWYPRPSSEDFAPASADVRHARGLARRSPAASCARCAPRRGARAPSSGWRQPGKYVTAIVGRLVDVGLRQDGEQSVRGYGTPRTRSDDASGRWRCAQEMLAFYAALLRALPLPVARPRARRGRDARRPQPAGLVYVQERPPMLRAASPTTPPTSRTCPASSWPTSWRTSGGARARRRRATGSAGCRRPGPSTRPRCGCASGGARTPSAA